MQYSKNQEIISDGCLKGIAQLLYLGVLDMKMLGNPHISLKIS